MQPDSPRLTLARQLHAPPHAALPVVELDGVLPSVLLRGLRDLQEDLLAHHAALDAVGEGDGRVPAGETPQSAPRPERSAAARRGDSLVVPRDLQQVVVVADERVEPDALVCAGDLQRRGGVGCGLESESDARPEADQARRDVRVFTDEAEDFVHQVFETWRRTETVNHLLDRDGTQSSTLILQIQLGRVLPSVVLQNHLVNAGVLLGNLTQEINTPRFRYGRCRRIIISHSSEKASSVWCYGCSRKHIYMT